MNRFGCAALSFLLLLLVVSPGLAADQEVRLTASKTEVEAGERFYLSWNVKGAEKLYLYVRHDEQGTFQRVEGVVVPNDRNNVWLSASQPGMNIYMLAAWIGSRVVMSNHVTVNVRPGKADSEWQGMDNLWRAHVVIFRNVETPNFKKSFSDREVKHIRAMLDKLPETIYGLSDGRMRLKICGISEVTEPVGHINYYNRREEGIFQGEYVWINRQMARDTTLIIVYAPFEGLKQIDWLGIGGTSHNFFGHKAYLVELSSAYANPPSGTWVKNGVRYELGTCALVHEILHCVECNSESNGWDGFEILHSADVNGYSGETTAFLDWYSDLMTDSIKTGKPGFRDYSFYVTHDADVTPVKRIQWGTERIDEPLGKVFSIYIPPTVTYIAPDAIAPGTIIFGEENSAADAYAQEHGFMFFVWEP